MSNLIETSSLCDLDGNSATRVFIGEPHYHVGPCQKTLWKVPHNFTGAERRLIYEVAKNYDLAFGKSIYYPRHATPIVFQCWFPHSTLVDISAEVKRMFTYHPYGGGVAKEVSKAVVAALERMKTDPNCMTQKCVVSFRFFRNLDHYCSLHDYHFQADTYCEALEKGVFQIGMAALEKVFA